MSYQDRVIARAKKDDTFFIDAQAMMAEEGDEEAQAAIVADAEWKRRNLWDDKR